MACLGCQPVGVIQHQRHFPPTSRRWYNVYTTASWKVDSGLNFQYCCSKRKKCVILLSFAHKTAPNTHITPQIYWVSLHTPTSLPFICVHIPLLCRRRFSWYYSCECTFLNNITNRREFMCMYNDNAGLSKNSLHIFCRCQTNQQIISDTNIIHILSL